MADWFLCFDPWLGLKTPAPALYPEWGERFFHYPGPLTDAQRQDIGLALETGLGLPECWLLAPASQNAEAVTRAAGQIRAALPMLGGLTPVIWRTPREIGFADTEAPAGLWVDLVFDGNLDARSAQLAQTLLLPLALRFLLGRGQWLDGRGAGPVSRLALRSGPAAMRPALDGLRARLDEAASHARHRLDALDGGEFKAAIHTTETPPFAEALKIAPPEPFKPGPWYRPQLDERAAADWVAAAVDSVLLQSAGFSRKLEERTREALREMSRRAPNQAVFGQTPQALKARFTGALSASPAATAPSTLPSQASQIRQTHTLALVRAVRCRPRRGLFAGFALGLLALAAGFCGLGAAWEGPYPSLWQALPAGALATACIACVWLAQWPTQRAGKTAQAELRELARAAEIAADNQKNAANAKLQNLLLHRNLDIVEAEIERRQAERGQWNYHLARMQAVCDSLGLGRLSEARQASIGLRLDPAQPETLNPAYFWAGGDSPELRLGQDRLPLDDPAGRFGGVETLIVNGGRG